MVSKSQSESHDVASVYLGLTMHILEAYFCRESSLPSATQNAINALERGAEIYVPCQRCKGERYEANRGPCRTCSGAGKFLRRYDGVLKLWREGLAEQTRRCAACDGVGLDCEECDGKGWEQALDAQPKGGPQAHEASETYCDTSIDVGWRLKRLPAWVQEVMALWFRPDAVAYRARLGRDAGHAEAAPLLPLTPLGRLAYELEKIGDTERVNAIIDAAYKQADDLKRKAFREFNEWRLVHNVSGGEARGRQMQYGKF